MNSYKDKKWYILQPVYGGKWGIPDINTPWTNDSNITLGKLLQAPANHFSNDDIDFSADIYILIIFGTGHYPKELELIKKLKSLNKKIIIAFSADDRFQTGAGLLNSDGLNYTDLCSEADLIWSALPAHIKVYGRYQHKVIDMGIFLERVNFSLPYENRDIDILLSGSIYRHEPSLSYTLELMCMLKEKYPEKRIVYPTMYHELLTPLYPQIEFLVPDEYMYKQGMVPLLQRTKIYINPENRPNPGRAMVEAFYCRTPYVCSRHSYAAKYYPDFTYDYFDLIHMVEQYEKILESDRDSIIKKSEQLAENDYFENKIQEIMNRLYPEEV
jgi:hypothetical protein